MTATRKWLALALLMALLVGIAALAAGLPGMRLKEGQPFRLPLNDERAVDLLGGDSVVQRGVVLTRGVISAIVIVYAFFILIGLLNKKGRQKLIRDLMRLAAITLCLVLLNTHGKEVLKSLQFWADPASLGEAMSDADVPLAEFNPTTPRWIPIGLLTAAALLLAAWVAAVAWWWFKPTRAEAVKTLTARQKLSAEAQQAVHDLEEGEELEDVILRAYYRMERILAEQRGLERPEAMTPSEFAEALGQQGLPKGAVNDLTHLFEAVRYGGGRLGADQQERAVNALRAITLVLPDRQMR